MSKEKEIENLDFKIKEKIKSELFPNVKTFLLRALVVHLMSTIIILVFCPQLGIQLFKTSINLSHLLMMYGKEVCDLFCGILFISFSLGINFFLMTRDEFRYLRYNKLPFIGVLLLSSFGILFTLNPNLFYELTLFWMIGFIGGILGTYFSGLFILRRV